MAGLTSPQATILQVIWTDFSKSHGRKTRALNAGYASYSTIQYILQAKYLVPIVQPDIVVVNFDETDLANDYSGRLGVVRDYSGNMVSFGAHYKGGLLGLMYKRSQGYALYLSRLLLRLSITRVLFPLLDELYGRPSSSELTDKYFIVSKEKSEVRARQIYSAQILNFSKNLDELSRLLLKKVSGKIIYATYPHLQHFRSENPGWNRIIAEIIESKAVSYGIPYYDGLPDLEVRFGSDPSQLYIPNDMHFNARGLAEYAHGLAIFINSRSPEK